MDTFLKKTFKSNVGRDTTFDNASRELERQTTKIYRLQKEMDTINAVKDEMRLKLEYMNEIMTNYPIMAAKNGIDPGRDVHNYNIVELKIRFKQFIENAKVDKAARLIQSNWRAAKQRERDEIQRIKEIKAT